MSDVRSDSEARYQRALKLVEKIREQWEAEGSPLTTEGGATGRAMVPHPLVKMLAEAERDADRFAKSLGVRHAGPKPVATVEAALGKSPAAKLRAVG